MKTIIICSSEENEAVLNKEVQSKDARDITEETGFCLQTLSQFKLNLLNYAKESDEKYTVSYSHNRRFFVKSDEFVGELKMYPSKLENAGPCLYVRKNQLLETMTNSISEMLKKPVKLRGKESNTLFGCYIDTVFNANGDMCVNALVDNSPALLPVEKLYKKICKLSAVLRSVNVKKVKNEYVWNLNIHELKIDELSKDALRYFVRSGPKISFF